ncbi:MAG: hypothetical protein COU29_03920 [Candidatus Magasanikbacteria bacterium CG10_big_fil_rev_8_21_14_0_10_36_32]|uniref:O-antigen ligase-related domain-containing protein n=1 Tax=Candidatus Magasanikbacteria bacterium CG10_big_fil_rev_8_21_14_0_10_36_32 TaxID=1974646 RepID=A0A2M6W5T0_9BACT|nr:MAG: hypothetical protein COU29_03920 [Candidatus Magasanikbacteria bacterium CG10_big_fil_rev_8_21_14_0_10_36_32]
MKRKLEWLIKILIYSTFFIPLVVIPGSFIFPFIVPKILLFRTLVTIMLAAFVILLFINWNEYKLKFTPITVALFIFLLSFIISTFIGVDPYHSFWDNHERMLGLFTIFHFIAYYYLCSTVFKNWTEWKWALRFFLLAGSLVMFIGALQVGSPQLLLNGGAERVSSTLGNSIYVGGYALFLIFTATLLIVKEKNNFWRGTEILVMVLAFLNIFFSGSRGAFLGLCVGAVVALAVYVLVLKQYKKIRFTIAGLLGLSVVILSLFYTFRQTQFVQNIPALGRTVNTTWSVLTATARWKAWEVGIKGWNARPVFGWGPNNYFYVFNQLYNPHMLDHNWGETWFDNAHNILINTMTVQGTVGILSYLAIFIIAIISLVGAFRAGQVDYHIFIIGGGFLVAHLVQNVTVFENPTSYLYFMFWLAMINRLTSANKENALSDQRIQIKNKNEQAANKQVGPGLCLTVGIISFICILLFDLQPARANNLALQAIKKLNSNPPQAVPLMKEALAFNSPHIDDIRSDIARTSLQVANNFNQQLGLQMTKEILDLAYNNLKKNLDLHPRDIRNQITLASMDEFRARFYNDVQYLVSAENLLEDALSYSPTRQQVLYSLASLKMDINKPQEAIRLLEQAINDNANIGESYWRLAYVYQSLNDMQKAREILDLGKDNNAFFSDNDKNIIAQYLSPVLNETK